MWTLGRFLPFVICHWILKGNEHWENFIRLLEIMDILFARCIPAEECGYLEALISDHHSCFKDLYPHTSITLKMHSMVHMPRLIFSKTLITIVVLHYDTCLCVLLPIYRFGPIINHWTTSFEAKHKYFKHLANVTGNFTNICYSLALSHQLHQCYRSLNSTTLPGEETEFGPGMWSHACMHAYRNCIFIYT